MDSQIEKLGIILRNNPFWSDSIRIFHQLNLSKIYQDAFDATIFFAYHYNPKEVDKSPLIDRYWKILWDSNYQMLRQLDISRLSEMIIEYSSHLDSFSYRESQFRQTEQDLLNDLQMPQKGWERYWQIIDSHKENTFTLLKDVKDRSLSNFIQIDKLYYNGPGSSEPLSPFKWNNAVITGVSTLAMAVNGFIGFATAGIGFASMAAPIIALSYLAGKS